MRKYFAILISTAIVHSSIGCKEPSTSNSPASVSYQTSACISSALGKRASGGSTDSIFTYSFTSTGLNLDFSVGATCGRPENAFIVQHTVHDDTIDVNVIDTCIAHARCTCIYMVAVSNIPVSQDRYLVRCTFVDTVFSYSYVAHFVEVHR